MLTGEMHMITAGNIKVYSSFAISRLADMEMDIKEGSHGRLTIRGYLSGFTGGDAACGDSIRITVRNDGAGEEEILFDGIIQETHIFFENGVNQIILTAATHDIKLDAEKKCRSFQDVSATYLKIIQDTVSEHNGIIKCEKPSVKTGKPVLQYEETDWEFCRRMAGCMGLGIFSSAAGVNPELVMGLPEGKKVCFPMDKYICCADEDYYREWKGDGVSRQELLYYRTESLENHDIGDSAVHHNRKLYIFRKKAELRKSVLVFSYSLGGIYRFMKRKRYNKSIAGLTLTGTVERTEGESVYLRLDIDGNAGKALYPYPWRPVQGNIMYCMPQNGTRACLYFPDRDEGNAVAVNSMHTYGSGTAFSDPQGREFSTEHGKQMQVHADGIRFSGGRRGREQFFSIDEESCRIKGGIGKLAITGKGSVSFSAPSVSITTPLEINQYRNEYHASGKAGSIYPRGSRNPSTGGDTALSMQYEFNGLASQGILDGTEYEEYNPFDDEPEYANCYPTWLKIAAGVAVALLVGVVIGAVAFVAAPAAVAVAGITITGLQIAAIVGGVTAGVGIAAAYYTAWNDDGTAGVGEYVGNSFKASAITGGIMLSLLMIPEAVQTESILLDKLFGFKAVSVFGKWIWAKDLFTGIHLTGGIINAAFQTEDLRLFFFEGKELHAPVGNETYDRLKTGFELLSLETIVAGILSPVFMGKLASLFNKNKDTMLAESEGGTDVLNTLTDAQKSRLNALDNTINDHLTEGDFSGTLRDLQGNPVPNGKGGYFDHIGEMQDSYRSLQKIRKALEGSLRNPNLSDVDRALLQEGLDKALSYILKIEKLFAPYGGIK